MEVNNNATCLLNSNYKALLTKGRTYAAFNDSKKAKDELTPKKCASILANRGIREILDPMAGYGTIMRYGEEYQFSSYMVEINLPAHLWQLLISEKHSDNIIHIINNLLIGIADLPEETNASEMSTFWFGPQALNILVLFFEKALKISKEYYDDTIIAEKIALAIVLPYCMRLSTAQKGDAVHVKYGGVAVLKGYKEHLSYYLSKLLMPLIKKDSGKTQQMSLSASQVDNVSIYADSAAFEFPSERYGGMLTSPPYPNSIDYRKMFIAENVFIKYLSDNHYLHFPIIDTPIIGTNVVSGREDVPLKSSVAKQFLNQLQSLKLNKQARYDMEVYYLPYYRNYFADMEKAYANVAKSLAYSFIGYIIVNNNAARKIEVPVSSFMIQLWESLGFNASSIKDKEIAHIGTKNPHSKGRMARHTEHIIKVWRNLDE